MVGSILGTRVLRVEDPRFITTGGRYVDDLRIDGDVPFAGAAVVHYVRSAVAHGTITAIDTDEAKSMPGVIAVFTAADLGLEPVPARFNPTVARPLLATDRVRFVGEPIAAIVATTAAAAADAADAVIVDYEVLDGYVDPLTAIDGDTLLFDTVDGNVVLDSTAMKMPGLTSSDDFFADCEVVVTGHFVNQRMAPCPLEGRSAAAAWIDDRLVVWMSTQHAHGARDFIAQVSGLDASAVRVVTPDVGGGFGAKITPYPEELLLGRLAKELGRPVAWTETRSESMTNLGHGRAQIHDVNIGGTEDGRVTHYQLDIVQESRRLRRSRRRAPGGDDPPDGVGRLRHRQHRVPRPFRAHQHTTDRRVPRRRPAGGHGGDRAGHRPVRRRTGPRSGRDPPAQPHRSVPRSALHVDRPDL